MGKHAVWRDHPLYHRYFRYPPPPSRSLRGAQYHSQPTLPHLASLPFLRTLRAHRSTVLRTSPAPIILAPHQSRAEDTRDDFSAQHLCS